MKKIIATSLLIVLLNINIISAETYNDYVSELNYIDSQLSILINLIVENDYKDIKPVEKDLIFLESLLTSLGKKIDESYANAKTLNDKSFFLTIDNISNSYELSAINIRRFFSGKKIAKTFVDVVSNYSDANKELVYINSKLKEAK